MGIGAYRHVVTLKQPGEIPSPPVWHCSVQSAAAQIVDGQSAFLLRGRFHPDITTETQLLLEGRTLQVQSIVDMDERHVDVQLLCVEVVARAG